MEIEYVNRDYKSIADFRKVSVLIEGQRHLIPQTSIAYAQALTEGRKHLDYDIGIQEIQKKIRDVVNCKQLDDARVVYVSYNGSKFEESLHYKEDVLYGKYGFKAILFDDSLLIGTAIEEQNTITFLPPEQVFN